MYHVYIPSKSKPILSSRDLRYCAHFSGQGRSRCIFDETGKAITQGGVTGPSLREFLNKGPIS